MSFLEISKLFDAVDHSNYVFLKISQLFDAVDYSNYVFF